MVAAEEVDLDAIPRYDTLRAAARNSIPLWADRRQMDNANEE